jgi:electron transfer flavoprotein alpha subunit
MADNKGILIVAETANDKLAAITLELLGAGRKLAKDTGEEVAALLIGEKVAGFAKDAIASGADKVFVAEDPIFKDYQTETWTTALQQVIKENNPRVVLMGQTSIGRDLAPRLAFRIGTTAAMDCIDITVDATTKQLQLTKPVYGGNARAIFVSDAMPQMATVRAKTMTPIAPDASRQGQTIAVKIAIDASKVKTKVLGITKEEIAGIKLEDAQVVISGGRGVGGPEGFKTLDELAKVMKAAVGASRPPADNGWVPATMQVGLTGKIVSPELYIAIGISGASQHLAGCSGAKTIVAINKDPEANIFKEAKFGVVGDWKAVLPAFTAKVKELVSG